MPHVFISYQQADSDFASLLMIQLERAGIDTWMDKERLRPGSDWSETIDWGIRESFAVVVVMSPDAKSSEYVTYEWAHALGAGIRVIPILIRETVLHPRLARIQYLKFTDPAFRPWDILIQELREAEGSLGAFRISRNTPAYIQRAISDLDSANPQDRQTAIRCLADSQELIARDVLIFAQKHPLQDVRAGASIALAHANDSRALAGMEEALRVQQREAATSILSLSPAAACPFLVGIIDRSDDLMMKQVCLATAGRLACQDAIPALVRALDSPPEVKQAAIRALTDLNDERVLPTAIAVLSAPVDHSFADDSCEAAAVNAVIKLAQGDAVNLLCKYVSEKSKLIPPSSRYIPYSLTSAANAIIQRGNCKDLQQIETLLENPNLRLAGLMANLIGKLKCREYAEALRRRLGNESQRGAGVEDRMEFRKAAERALEALADD